MSRFLDIEAELSSENDYDDEEDEQSISQDDNDFIDDSVQSEGYPDPPPRFSPTNEPNLSCWMPVFTTDRHSEDQLAKDDLKTLPDPREGGTQDQLLHILHRTAPDLLPRHQLQPAIPTGINEQYAHFLRPNQVLPSSPSGSYSFSMTVTSGDTLKKRKFGPSAHHAGSSSPLNPLADAKRSSRLEVCTSKRKKTLAEVSASAAPFGSFFVKKLPAGVKKDWAKWAAGHPVAPDTTVPRRELAPGEWVKVRSGPYRDDVGIVWRPDKTESGVNGYFILVIPRLADELERPPPRLFEPKDFGEAVEQESEHTFRFQRKTFTYGLLIKFFRDLSLSSTRVLPPDLGSLFLLSKHPFLESFPLPLPQFFVFLVGDSVNLPRDGRTGVIEEVDGKACVVNFGNDERHVHAVDDLQKVVVPGDSIQVIAGVHSGKEGLVVERQASILRVFTRNDTHSRTTLFIHVNSVRICRLSFDSHDDTPWLGIDVVILRGRYCDMRATVKGVRLTPLRDRIKLSLYIAELACSVEVGIEEVAEAVSKKGLLEYRPLKESQRSRFAVDKLMVKMRTGRVPWIGLRVSICGGVHRGKTGVVKDVDRSSQQSSDSGIHVAVELEVVSGSMYNRTEKIEYDLVREIDSGLELAKALPLSRAQEFYRPRKHKVGGTTVSQRRGVIMAQNTVASSTSTTPLHASEYESLDWDNISDPWNPHSLSPAWSSPGVFPPPSSPASPHHPSISNAVDTAPPSPPKPRMPPQPLVHWLLHPKLRGIPIRVTIARGKWKKKTVFVTPTCGEHGTIVVMRHKVSVYPIDVMCIDKHCDRPKPNCEQSLMIVTAGNDQHVGKLVRRIFYFYNEVKSDDARWFLVGVVDRTGRTDNLTGELLELPPADLEIVEESKEDREAGNALFEGVRYAAKVGKPEVRRPGEGDLGNIRNACNATMVF
ncbi:hypothetical protein PQX77_003137 [Marasmius sp. AFHP31]|nr:hypothetical protein PQX77_003137 [Marasmius sp. AFHP31]